MASFGCAIRSLPVLFAVVLAAPAAEAACAQADLAGRWQMFGLTADRDQSNVVTCALEINRIGQLTGRCVGRIPGAMARTRLSGRLTLRRNCSIAGRGEEEGVPGTVQAQMAPSGETFAGIIFTGLFVTSFTAVAR